MIALKKFKRIHILLLVLVICMLAYPFRTTLRAYLLSVIQIMRGKKTVSQRVRQYEDDVHARLGPLFEKINVQYPPDRMLLVALKDEKLLEVWVSEENNGFKRLKMYPILAGSGRMGPKLREGDAQVPEGVYQVDSLNPNSMYHLAIRLNYPNEFDLQMATLDGRRNVGGAIMIHGSNCSVGCLAMGDQAAEDLFVLAALMAIENVSVIISPVDFRVRELPADMPPLPPWTSALYKDIRRRLAELKNP